MSSDPPVAAGNVFGREPSPPLWDGSDPGINYPTYVKNVKLWQYETELPEAKQGVRLLRGLTGTARAVCDGLEFEQVATTKGVENILARLKERAPRSHKEDFQDYLIRIERAFFMLSKALWSMGQGNIRQEHDHSQLAQA